MALALLFAGSEGGKPMIANALVDEVLRYAYVLLAAGTPTILGIALAAAVIPGILRRRIRRGLAA
jgi:hypothetical protein